MTSKTLPALPNRIPYNEMLFRGLLKVGDCQAKTRSWVWDYRGLILLYTSSKTDWHPVRAYEFDPAQIPTRALVGVAKIVDSRELSPLEEIVLTCRFNNIKLSERQMANDARRFGFLNPNRQEVLVLVEPLPIGFFLKDVIRFKTPVPYKWPQGPVRHSVPISVVAEALKEIGIDPRDL